MRSPRAIMAGLGTSGSLLAAVACVLALASALIAFHGWPGGGGLGGRAGAVRIDDRTHPASRLLAGAARTAKPAARGRRGVRRSAPAAPRLRRDPGGAARRAASGTRTRAGGRHDSPPSSRPGRGAGGSTVSVTPPSSRGRGISVTLPSPVDTVSGGVTQTTGHLGSAVGRTTGGLDGTVSRVSPGAGSVIAHAGEQVGGTVTRVGQSAGGLLPGR